MAERAVVVGGREFPEDVLERIRGAVRDRPMLTRAGLAREVCQWLSWKRPDGRWREMGCRLALLKLEQRGLINLPPPRRQIARPQPIDPASIVFDQTPIRAELADVGTIELVLVADRRSPEAKLWKAMIAAHHYCGYKPLVGAQLRFLIRSKRGWLGATSFSACARHVAARDRFIGWSTPARVAHREEVIAQSRFLLLPWVEVANLASKVLSLCTGRIAADWRAAYGYEPLLVETYVERPRFTGCCYRAAGWIAAGSTAGRGRQDRDRRGAVPVKDIYLYPLRALWKEKLCREPLRARAATCRGAHAPTADSQDASWATREFAAAPVGDRRLAQRLVTVAEDFYARPQANIPQACGTRARTKAAYRLLDHSDLTLRRLHAAHYASTVARMRAHRVVLAVQDTTSLNYTSHPSTKGLGLIGSWVKGPRGLLVHDTMAFTVDGLALGLLDVQAWARDESTFGKKKQRHALPIEQKESAKWLRSFEAAAAAQRELPDTVVVSVGDREGDIYELFQLAASRADHPQLLVRAEHDRLLGDGQQRLWATVSATPIAGYQDVDLPRRGSRAARVAKLAVRWAVVELPAPRNRPHAGGPLRVWAVLAQEVDAPQSAEPLEWMLLTTIEVRTLDQAVEKLRWYAQRWQIEVYHRTLKSGCRVEDRQLATAQRLENCLAIDMVVAWRILHLTHLGRTTPEAPCTVVFEDYQWQALYGFLHKTATPPANPPSLQQAIHMVARLGGFLARTSDGNPGTKSLWLGLQRLDDIAHVWRILSAQVRAP